MKMTKFYFIFTFILINLYYTNSAPVALKQFQVIPITVLQGRNPQRLSIGDFLANQGFLPIEINVPDTVGAIYNGAQNIYNGLSTFTGNIIQRLPFINRFTSPNDPRPLRILLLLPTPPSSEQKLLLPVGNIPPLIEMPNLKYEEDREIANTETQDPE